MLLARREPSCVPVNGSRSHQFECNSLSVRVLAPNRCTKPGRIDSTGCHDGHCHSGMKTWRLTAWCMQQLSEYEHPHCLLYFCMPTPPVECKPTVRSNSGSHSILLGVEASPAFAPPNFWLWLVDTSSMVLFDADASPSPPPLPNERRGCAATLSPQILISLSSRSSCSSDLPLVSGRTKMANSVAAACSENISR